MVGQHLPRGLRHRGQRRGARAFCAGAAGLGIGTCVLGQGLLWLARGQQGGGLALAAGLEDADQNVAQLHLATFHPGPGIVPQLVAIGAVGVGEHIDRARRVGAAIRYGLGALHIAPQLLAHGLLHGGLQGLGVHVAALGVDHRAQHPVLSVRHAVDGHGLAVAVGGPGLEPAHGRQRSHQGQSLLGQEILRWQLGRRSRQGQGCRQGQGSCQCRQGKQGGSAHEHSFRCWARLARDNSPMRMPHSRPSAP